MSVELLGAIVVAIISLMCAYLPGVKKWYGALTGERKATVMGIMLVLTSFAVFGLTCTALAVDFGLTLTCDKSGAVTMAKILITALMANQATFTLAVRPFQKI